MTGIQPMPFPLVEIRPEKLPITCLLSFLWRFNCPLRKYLGTGKAEKNDYAGSETIHKRSPLGTVVQGEVDRYSIGGYCRSQV